MTSLDTRRTVLVPVLLVLLALLCAVLASQVVGLRVDVGAAPAARPADQHPAPDRRTERAVRILRQWDAARARAWAAGDARALARLYTPGSSAGVRDRDWLSAYAGRGLVVRGMARQLLAADVHRLTSRALTLVVTDRLARGVAMVGSTPGLSAVLPRDQPTTYTITMVRRGRAWLVRSVA